MSAEHPSWIAACSEARRRSLLRLALPAPKPGVPLPQEARDQGRLGELLDSLPGKPRGPRLISAILDPRTSLAVLRDARQRAANATVEAPSEAARHAARVAHHAATAAAIAWHRVDLSSRPAPDRHRLFAGLAAALHGEPLAEVFHAALARGGTPPSCRGTP